MTARTDNALGEYLKDRRTRLDPLKLGLPLTRRRTPGLRREEVAARANVSPTWYTWLEQGRGGAPSAEVIDQIANALMLSEAEREHLFLLALGRLPDVRYRAAGAVAPLFQRMIDAMEISPVLVRTPTWDVVAWNSAASAVLTDYGALPMEERNIIRQFFCNPRIRAAQPDWEDVARFLVAAFRADVARAGAAKAAEGLVDDLRRRSSEFDLMWRDNDVRSFGQGTKCVQHPIAGPLRLEFSAFAVDGRPDLAMVVYNPATHGDARQIRSLVESETSLAS
ncbi:MAG TPA: helix-turn-helix transcriptional regulator [Mycobacterium sp.]|nr:helix-turn-helix transcriptional regulator [Mycobacterium sp.]